MNNISFSPTGWDEYLHWQMQDKKTLRRINQLLKDIRRSKRTGRIFFFLFSGLRYRKRIFPDITSGFSRHQQGFVAVGACGGCCER